MAKEITAEEVYEKLSVQGAYEEAHFDSDVVQKVLGIIEEDYAFGKELRQHKAPSWRVIFNVHYDVLRELCNLLLLFKGQKCSNHQGLFAFVVLSFQELALDWNILDNMRSARNRNKYEGLDISKEMLRSVELSFDLYISTLRREIKKKLG